MSEYEKMTLYKEVCILEIPHDHHESDLYIPVTDKTRLLEKKWRNLNWSKFKSQIDGKMWYEIAFAYQPFWDKKQGKKNPASKTSLQQKKNESDTAYLKRIIKVAYDHFADRYGAYEMVDARELSELSLEIIEGAYGKSAPSDMYSRLYEVVSNMIFQGDELEEARRYAIKKYGSR